MNQYAELDIPTQVLLPSGKTVLVNRAWQELWSVQDEAVESTVLRTYNILTDPLMIEMGIRPLVEIALKGTPVTSLPVKYDPKQIGFPGRVRWVVANFKPVFVCGDLLDKVVLTFRDVTPTKGGALEHVFENVREFIEITPVGTFIKGTSIRPLTVFRLLRIDELPLHELQKRYPELTSKQITTAIQFCEQVSNEECWS